MGMTEKDRVMSDLRSQDVPVEGADAVRTGSCRYRTVVADPPWRYTKAHGTGKGVGRGRAAEAHYDTMTTEEIAALPVAALADDEAHLYLWVTNPLLTDQRPDIKGHLSGPAIARAWGFEPKALVTWVKSGIGPGWYFRGATEHFIFATRGDLQVPAAARERNVFEAPRGAHSAKPDAFYDMVERVAKASGAEPMVEMFARRARFGWSYWGDESLQTAEMAS